MISELQRAFDLVSSAWQAVTAVCACAAAIWGHWGWWRERCRHRRTNAVLKAMFAAERRFPGNVR